MWLLAQVTTTTAPIQITVEKVVAEGSQGAPWWLSLVAAFGGAILGGAFAMFGGRWEKRLDDRRQWRVELATTVIPSAFDAFDSVVKSLQHDATPSEAEVEIFIRRITDVQTLATLVSYRDARLAPIPPAKLFAESPALILGVLAPLYGVLMDLKDHCTHKAAGRPLRRRLRLMSWPTWPRRNRSVLPD